MTSANYYGPTEFSIALFIVQVPLLILSMNDANRLLQSYIIPNKTQSQTDKMYAIRNKLMFIIFIQFLIYFAVLLLNRVYFHWNIIYKLVRNGLFITYGLIELSFLIRVNLVTIIAWYFWNIICLVATLIVLIALYSKDKMDYTSEFA